MTSAGAPAPIRAPSPATLGVFLACSWTWCIGMWFPVLLARDFGAVSWLVFAIPNVIGAMSVGFVLARPGAAARLLHEHTGAVDLFSAWTILFHIAFLTWFFVVYPVHFLPGPVVGALCVVGTLLVAALGWRGRLRAGWAALIVSAGAVAGMLLTGGPAPALSIPGSPGTYGGRELAMMAPLIAFGFLFCPYLDATFLGARATVPGRRGTLGFVLGFGAVFGPLVALTLGYAGRLIDRDSLSYYLALHLAAQSVFTAGIHLRWLGDRGVVFQRAAARGRLPTPAMLLRTAGFAIAGFAVFLVAAWASGAAADGPGGRTAGRTVYDAMLSAYAVVFPAYVLTVVAPWPAARRARLLAWALSVGLATPLVALGAFWREWGLLPLGVGAMLLGPALAIALGRLARRDGSPEAA